MASYSFDDTAPTRKGDFYKTQQIAAERYDRKTFIKSSLRELLIYSVFFACLCIVAFGTVDTPMYYYTHVVRRLFMQTKFETDDKQIIDMNDINTMSQFWDFLSNVIVKSVDWSFWYSDSSIIAATTSEDKNILFENRLIGRPRIRQVRVTNISCKIPEEFKPVFTHCYGEFNEANEEKGRIPKQGQQSDSVETAWVYSSAEDLGTYAYRGIAATYTGGGYYLDLTKNPKTDEAAILALKSNLWLTRATRAVFIDFSTYNANINVFSFIKLLFEFPPTGGVLASGHFNTMKLIRYHGAMGIILYICEAVVGLYAFYFIFEELCEILSLKTDYFHSWWTYLDLLILFLLIAFVIIDIARAVIVNTNLQPLIDTTRHYSSFDQLIVCQHVFHYVLAFLVFFATIKFLKYLKMNIIMNRLLTILYESSPALFGFAVIFFLVLFAFALLGHLLFGTEVLWFSSISDSFFSLHLMLLGDINYQDLVDANRITGPLFFCAYIFLIFFILLNMFLAILNERFWAKNKQIDLESDDNLCTVLKQSLQNFMDRFGCSSLVTRWRKRDDDRKGITRLKRLRASLARAGFSEAEITAFLDKYEIDEEALAADNADELIRKLRNDFQGLNSFDSSVQERIMNRIDIIENTLLGIHKKLDAMNLKLKSKPDEGFPPTPMAPSLGSTPRRSQPQIRPKR